MYHVSSANWTALGGFWHQYNQTSALVTYIFICYICQSSRNHLTSKLIWLYFIHVAILHVHTKDTHYRVHPWQYTPQLPQTQKLQLYQLRKSESFPIPYNSIWCLHMHMNLASYPGPSQLFNVARWKAGGPGSRNHVTFMCGWTRDLNNADLTFENSCLVSSSSASRLSHGRLLEYISAFYIGITNYVKSARMTFGSLSIACL